MSRKKENNRFQIILEEKHDVMSSSRILRDKETGALYLYHAWGYGGGMTPLLDSEGIPLAESPAQ